MIIHTARQNSVRHALARNALAATFLGIFLAQPTLAADKVNVGVLNAAGDIGLFVAQAHGYFQAEGIDANLTPLDSAVKMMPLLGSGDLDVGGGATSAALYNAAERKIDVRVVASRARTAPGYLYQGMVIRKDLVDSGRYKGFADLKGMKFGFASPGSTPASSLNEALKKVGLDIKAIELTYLNFPSQVLGLQNKAIDGTIMVEPYLGQVVASGAAAMVGPTEDYYPSAEVSVLLYGDKFIKERPDVARRFMRAFLKGARDFKDAVANGRWKTDGSADDVIRIFAKSVNMPEATIRAMSPQFADPDGAVNVKSLATDLAYFKFAGDVPSQTITADMIVDLSFAKKAAEELGPYKGK
jgi:NitT/TauT family transport system substrate-binding protein